MEPDYRLLLKQYMSVVDRHEGRPLLYESEWSRDDWLVLSEISAEIIVENQVKARKWQ